MTKQTETAIRAEGSDRIYLYDNIRGFLIFLVVFGHIMNLGWYNNDITKTIYIFIYFFHMPAFIFMSGYFSKNVAKCRETALVNYFVPYLFLVVFVFIQMKLLPIPGEPEFVFRVFSVPSGCWFLFAMFVWKLLIKDIARLRFSIPLFLLLGLLSGFSHEFGFKFSLGRICAFSIFFILGFYTEEKHVAFIRRIPWVVSCLLLYPLYRIAQYYGAVRKIPIDLVMNKGAYRDEFIMEDFIFRLVYYVIAAIFILILINLFPKKKTFLSKIGRNSFPVYIFHTLLVRFIDTATYDYARFKESPVFYLIFIAMMSVIVTYLLSRDICMRALNGFLSFVNKIIFRPSGDVSASG